MKQLSSSADGNPGYHFKYKDSATQNNGRVQSINDVTSGEAITYLYDSLNRLTQASGAHDPQGSWSQQFTYDGFGNLIQKNGNNAPNNLTINVDPTTNRLTGNGAVYDANGNLTQYTNTLANMTFSYDSLNRLATASGWNGGSGNTANYGYDPSNQRVYSNITVGGITTETFFFYGADGKKLGAWTIVPFSSTLTLVSFNTWFGGRLLKPQDRLNSIGKYFPYGEDRYSPHPANPTNGKEKFATYTRDAETGLDYAYQRYYTEGLGRFMTPDPYGRSASLGNPQSLNRYPYSGNDPVGSNDPSGLDPGFFFYPIPADPADPALFGPGGAGALVPRYYPLDPPGGDDGTSFREAKRILVRNLSDIAHEKKWSKDCQSLFSKLGITGAAVSARAAEGFTFEDATTSVDLQSGLYAYTSLSQYAANRFGTKKVWQFVDAYAANNNGKEIKAETVLNPNNISGANVMYLNPSYWGGSYYADRSDTLHELLHSITGDTDPDFANIFGTTAAFLKAVSKCNF